MATQKVYDIKLNSSEMEKSLDSLNNQMKTLNNESKALNDEQKNLEKQGKKNTKEWEENSKAIKKNNIELKQTKKDLDSVNSSAKKSTSGLKNMGKTIGGSVSKAFKGFGQALKANPIFFIIGIITAAVGFMKKALKPFQPLLDWVSDKIAYVDGLISGFMNSLSSMGDIISDVFSGNFSDAIDKANGLGDNIGKLAEATENLNKVMREQDAIQKENDLTTLESMAHQKELETILKDTNTSTEERAKALEELSKIQKGQALDDYNEKLARNEAINNKINASLVTMGSNIKDITKVSSDELAELRNAGELTKEQYDEVIATRTEMANVNAASADVDLKLQKYKTKIETEENVRQKKAHDDYIKRKEAEAKAEENRIKAEAKAKEDLVKATEKVNAEIEKLNQQNTLKMLKGTEDYFNKQKEYEDDAYKEKQTKAKAEIKDDDLLLLELEKLRLEHNQKIVGLEENKTKMINDAGKVELDNKLKLLDEEYIANEEELTSQHENELILLQEALENEFLTEEEYNEKKKELDAEYVANKKELDAERIASEKEVNDTIISTAQQALSDLGAINDAWKDAQVQKTEKQYNKEAKLLQDKLDKGEIDQEEYDAAMLKADRDRIKKENEINEKSFNAQKAMDLITVAINTTLGITQAIAQMGPVAGAIAAVGIGISGGISAGIIASKQFVPAELPTAAGGGLIQGQSHQGLNGGVPIMMEGNEWAINKASSVKYDSLLNSVNQAGNSNGDVNNVDDIFDYDRLANAMGQQEVVIVDSKIKDSQKEVDIRDSRTSF